MFTVVIVVIIVMVLFLVVNGNLLLDYLTDGDGFG